LPRDERKLLLARSRSVQRKGLVTSTPRTERDVASLARYDVAGVSLPVSLERISCLVTLATLLAYIRPGPNVIKNFLRLQYFVMSECLSLASLSSLVYTVLRLGSTHS
jgi:hypothetical protein